MTFKQLFDQDTYTFSYLLADDRTRQALIIDPVETQLEHYLTLLQRMDLSLLYVLDTHTHADHISANGALRKRTQCRTLIGKESGTLCADQALQDGDDISLGNGDQVSLQVMHTPGHTDDSYSFYCAGLNAVFTGDTLLINGTGRCDFQNGSAKKQYASLFSKILTLPSDTQVYPGHDYNGRTHSTIAQEKRHNPRLQVNDVEDYMALMGSLNLPVPKYMDVAVPANKACGEKSE